MQQGVPYLLLGPAANGHPTRYVALPSMSIAGRLRSYERLAFSFTSACSLSSAAGGGYGISFISFIFANVAPGAALVPACCWPWSLGTTVVTLDLIMAADRVWVEGWPLECKSRW